MPSISPQVTPYYGGGQVVAPVDSFTTSGAPSSANINHALGTLAIDNAAGNIYGLASKSGGTASWVLLGGSSGAISAVNGTTNQITANTAGNTVTLSLPSAITAPGSLTATTTLTATLGNITATNGNLSLATAGNKIVIATGSNASVGTSSAMSGTPGVVTVATTACSATAKIFYSRATTGGTPGNVSITAQDGTGFTLTSTGNETSTFNWWIINN